MPEKIRNTIFAIGLTLLVTGCAVYPVVQVAGGAMTGYDAVTLANEYLPRDSVKGGEICGNTDRMLERRLRERLKINHLATVSGHVIGRQAFLVGRFMDRSRADQAIAVASGVQGITTINCKFYPMGSPREAKDDSRLLVTLTQRLGESTRLDQADLRVEVIQGNAILIGSAGSWDQKTAAVAIAHEVGGIKDVVDYILITEQPETAPAAEPDGEEIAAK